MTLQILIVDDDATIRTTLSEALGEGDVHITVAGSAESAEEVLEHRAPDIVFSDVKLPGRSGIELLDTIRGTAPSADVVLMTAYDDVPTVVRALRGGAADFLCKPLDLGELRRVMAELAGRRGAGSPAGDTRARDASQDPVGTDAPHATRLRGRITAALSPRYAVQDEVGRGGMATVFRARDEKHDRFVAVKVLQPDLAATLGTERFLREIRIAARLTHPHILTLIDSGEAAGLLYYVMPFVDGESLRDRLERTGALPIGEAVRIVRDVADALACAHGMGVVHRDVKPENVILTGRHALVTDFGVAKALYDAGGAGATATGIAVGTPEYMSPEQAAGDPSLDHRSDVYALGVLAYELLTGEAPFTGPTPQAILAAQVVEPAEPVGRVRGETPAELASVVMRCLEKEPADRWPTVDALLGSLESPTLPEGEVAS